MSQMAPVYVVMMLAVLEYYAFGIAVGAARGRYKVPAPATSGLGLVYVVGRVVYFVGYSKDAKKRGVGFLIGALPTMVLLFGGLIGAAMAAL